MMDPPRYWTLRFVERFVAELQNDASFQKAARSFSGGVILRCFDSPDGTDMCAKYRIDRGRVTVDIEEQPAPCRSLRDEPLDKRAYITRTSAPYRIWTKLDRGEMNVLQVVTSPDYRLEGSKLRSLKNIGMFTAMNAVASRIPKTY